MAMKQQRDVVVLGAARSAVGTFGGSLADIEPSELAGLVMKEAIARSGVDPKAINYVTVGNTIRPKRAAPTSPAWHRSRPGSRLTAWRWPSTGCARRACKAS
jgi:acetyl-CoA acetyltransferase